MCRYMSDLTTLNQEGFNKYAQLIGIEFVEIGEGRCRAELDVREDHFHPGQIVHGGVAFSLADSSMAMAIISKMETGYSANTIELKISYMSAVTEGRMVSEAWIVKQGRKIAFMEARVTVGEKLVATATATFAMVKMG